MRRVRDLMVMMRDLGIRPSRADGRHFVLFVF